MRTTKVPAAARKGDISLRFFLADDVRMEQDNKVTAVGLYTDNVVVALMEPGQPEPSPQVPIVMGGLSFVVAIGGLEGKHTVVLKYSDPAYAATPTPKGQELVFANSSLVANVVARFQPFVASSFGKKVIVLAIDGKEHELVFEVRRGSSKRAPAAAPTVNVAVKKRAVAVPATKKGA